jgi:hypothetical protein
LILLLFHINHSLPATIGHAVTILQETPPCVLTTEKKQDLRFFRMIAYRRNCAKTVHGKGSRLSEFPLLILSHSQSPTEAPMKNSQDVDGPGRDNSRINMKDEEDDDEMLALVPDDDVDGKSILSVPSPSDQYLIIIQVTTIGGGMSHI